MRHIYIIIVLIIFNSTLNFSQNNNSLINWGPKLDHKGIYRILAITDENVFVMHHPRRRIFMGIGWVQILTFDKNQKKIISSVNADRLFKQNMLIVDCKVANGSVEFLTFHEERDGPHLELMKFDINLTEIIKSEEVYKIGRRLEVLSPPSAFKVNNEKNIIRLDVNNSWPEEKKSIQFAISKDKSKIIFKERTKINGKKIDKIVVLDRSNYSPINELKIQDDLKTDTRIENIRVDEKGQIFVLQRVDLSKKERKKRKTGPNYNYSLIKKAPDSKRISINIQTEKYHTTSSDILIDKNGNSYIFLMFGSNDDEPIGIATYMIDNENNLVYAKHNNSSILKDNKYIDEEYKIVNTFKTDERIVVMYRYLKSKFQRRPFADAGGMSYGEEGIFLYDYKDLVVEIYDIESNLIANNILQHHGKGYVTDEYLRYDIEYDENNFWTTTNIHAETYNKILIGETESKKYPNKNNIITRLIFDFDGNYKLDILSPEANRQVSRLSRATHKGLKYFIGSEKDGSNVQLGVMDIKK